MCSFVRFNMIMVSLQSNQNTKKVTIFVSKYRNPPIYFSLSVCVYLCVCVNACVYTCNCTNMWILVQRIYFEKTFWIVASLDFCLDTETNWTWNRFLATETIQWLSCIPLLQTHNVIPAGMGQHAWLLHRYWRSELRKW